ncbi:Tpk1p [Rhizophagus irregularis DAOM 197198w]|uniref:Tpk1p n=2 Tax=Rhizophagus irregularis TaxID=588596 RepID=A0A015JUY1_RHIIW|nr:Tpk1p [Rhizophagus irregularis DAOM 197198w]EXX74446.1 Tpk1p [Rhizophagus irregularis DAOM 197198w]
MKILKNKIFKFLFKKKSSSKVPKNEENDKNDDINDINVSTNDKTINNKKDDDDIIKQMEKIIENYSKFFTIGKLNKDVIIDYYKKNGNFNTKGIDPYEMSNMFKLFDNCLECGKTNTYKYWCQECNSQRFQKDFSNWTSGNKFIDNFIQRSQLQARNNNEVMEWIPYNRFKDIKFLAQGGFSTVFEAIWLDGAIEKWDYENQQWCRQVHLIDNPDHPDSGIPVVFKSLDNSSDISEDFLYEWETWLKGIHKSMNDTTPFIQIVGITQDPDTLNYMIIMFLAPLGSLKSNLKIKKYNPNDKFTNLFNISRQLNAIHKLDLIHGDFHNGNILFFNYEYGLISDFGLCRPVESVASDDVFGVLPYIAPEVLRGKPYTKAADIYSFGIIMWEMVSGISAFHNITHDLSLSLEICEGFRPKIVKGTMPEYVKLMNRCWNNNPDKRPTADELSKIFEKWSDKFPIELDEEKRKPVPENESEVIYHPEAYYISRKIDYTNKINEILAQNELSDKIEILDDNIDDNDSLENYIIEDDYY